jgi:glycosyltransferase involved in cell wall biosynthesis
LEKIPSADSLKRKPNNCCQLLFLGVEWERKGGQIALDSYYQLKKAGIDVRLTIIGCVPPVAITDSQIFVIPFLNKNNQEDAEKLYEIMMQTDFLILPTRAECAGVVFCEANAFGIPVISTDTGGVSSYVQDGINGFTLPLTATADAYADIILKLYQDTAAYEQLSSSSRKLFDSTLNWNHWGRQFNEIADRIVNQ